MGQLTKVTYGEENINLKQCNNHVVLSFYKESRHNICIFVAFTISHFRNVRLPPIDKHAWLICLLTEAKLCKETQSGRVIFDRK